MSVAFGLFRLSFLFSIEASQIDHPLVATPSTDDSTELAGKYHRLLRLEQAERERERIRNRCWLGRHW